jgi:hypothetical protein
MLPGLRYGRVWLSLFSSSSKAAACFPGVFGMDHRIDHRPGSRVADATRSESDRVSPQKMHPVAQARLQAGRSLLLSRSTHMSHFMAISLSSSNCMAPKGHASMHALQPMHSASSISTIPLGSVEMASTGQDSKQGAFVQW